MSDTQAVNIRKREAKPTFPAIANSCIARKVASVTDTIQYIQARGEAILGVAEEH